MEYPIVAKSGWFDRVTLECKYGHQWNTSATKVGLSDDAITTQWQVSECPICAQIINLREPPEHLRVLVDKLNQHDVQWLMDSQTKIKNGNIIYSGICAHGHNFQGTTQAMEQHIDDNLSPCLVCQYIADTPDFGALINAYMLSQILEHRHCELIKCKTIDRLRIKCHGCGKKSTISRVELTSPKLCCNFRDASMESMPDDELPITKQSLVARLIGRFSGKSRTI